MQNPCVFVPRYIYIPKLVAGGGNDHLTDIWLVQVGTDYIMASGFLELADANDMIVIFPQVRHMTINCNL